MLVFFHCHKAAGTTVIHAAKASGLKLPENHRNGNPFDQNGKRIDWDALSAEQAVDQLEGLKKQGVDMIALEFNTPAWSVLDQIDGLRLFTILRDPAARALSNFRMDVRNHAPLRRQVFGVPSYMNDSSLFRSNNYYTRFFCGVGPKAKLGRDHLQFAKHKLATFEQVCILERGDMAQKLAPLGFKEESFGWKNEGKSKKPSDFDPEKEWLDLKAFPDDPQFFAENCYDYALYAHFMYRAVHG